MLRRRYYFVFCILCRELCRLDAFFLLLFFSFFFLLFSFFLYSFLLVQVCWGWCSDAAFPSSNSSAQRVYVLPMFASFFEWLNSTYFWRYVCFAVGATRDCAALYYSIFCCAVLAASSVRRCFLMVFFFSFSCHACYFSFVEVKLYFCCCTRSCDYVSFDNIKRRRLRGTKYYYWLHALDGVSWKGVCGVFYRRATATTTVTLSAGFGRCCRERGVIAVVVIVMVVVVMVTCGWFCVWEKSLHHERPNQTAMIDNIKTNR